MKGTLEICRSTFDEIARLYDEARPCYPTQLVKDVLRHADLPASGAKVLEVGSGTGKGTEHFISNNFELCCVEPGPKSIEIARSKLAGFQNLSFINKKFEDLDVPKSSYDLVLSGQAFHWINGVISFTKAADVLKVGGSLALFWNTLVADRTDLDQALDGVYSKYVPLLSRETVESLPENIILTQKQYLQSSGYFESIKTKRYTWMVDYTAEAYIRLMQTFTHVHLLSAGVKRALFDGVRAEIINQGGVYTKSYKAVLIAARKVTEYIN
ncbi:MAG: class I SAM-dependent methyltransferase [Bdellovibrionota bacterium]